jgi:PE family
MDMSFVFAAPEMVSSAAGDLAGIRSALSEATSAASAPTTGVLAAGADEVSAAISQMFGAYGQEFQALSAEAAAFHDNFVGLLKSGASAYLGTEAASVQQILGGAAPAAAMGSVGQNFGAAAAAVSGQVQAEAQAMVNAIPGASAAIQGLNSFGATVAAPYQALNSNTMANLQAANSTFQANPAPFLHQFVNNQMSYGQTIATGFQGAIQNLPAELANTPANIQLGLQGLSNFNPGAALQQFVSGQTGTAQTISASLGAVNHDLNTGVAALPASFQAAGQDLMAGNPVAAGETVGQGLENVFLPGFQNVFVPLDQLGSAAAPPILINPIGPLGDLAPIFAIPGQMAQNFTNMLPAGSIPALMSQNATNLITTSTNPGATLNPGNLGINFGVPLQAIFDGVGAPVNALSALNSTGVAFTGALQAGNMSAAAAAILDAPANVANGFLNGQTLISLPPLTVDVGVGGVPLLSITSTAELPLGGLLAPLSPVVDNVLGPLAGTQIGGFIPGLLSFGPVLAGAITPTI